MNFRQTISTARDKQTVQQEVGLQNETHMALCWNDDVLLFTKYCWLGD